jgi:hypothetical protein
MLKICKDNEHIEKGVIELQKFVNSAAGRQQIEKAINGSKREQELAEEFNSLVCFFITRYILNGSYATVENILTAIVGVYQGFQRANLLMNLG